MKHLTSGFTANSEPIIIRRISDACGISIGPRKINLSIPFERDLTKLIFFWNYRDVGYSEEEIQEIWNKSTFSDYDEKTQESP